MSYLGIFGQKLKKTIVIFEISTLKFVYLKMFMEQQQCQSLGPKVPYLDIFDRKCLIWVFLG